MTAPRPEAQRARGRAHSRRTRDAARALRDAWQNADEPLLRRLLCPRVTLVIDRNGRTAAPTRPSVRRAAVAATLLQMVAERPVAVLDEAGVNGEPGLALRDHGQVVAVVSIGLRGRRIERIWVTDDPWKLTHWNRG